MKIALRNLCIMLLAVVLSCSDKEHTETNENVFSCQELIYLIVKLNTLSDEGIFIIRKEVFVDGVHVYFENGDSIVFDNSCVLSTIENKEEWFMNFEFDNGLKTKDLKYVGSISTNVILNPSSYCPLMCSLEAKAKQPIKLKTKVKGKYGIETDVIKDFAILSNEHRGDIYGLYPDYMNTIYLELYSPSDVLLLQDSVSVQTQAMENALPQIDITVMNLTKIQEGFNLVSERIYSRPSRPFMIDAYGECRWYLELDAHPQLFDLNFDVGIEKLENGNLYFGDLLSDAVYEIGFDGQVINSWDLAPYEFHHNVQEKPDGNFLVTVSNLGSKHQNGGNTVEDHIVEVDRSSGDIIKVWDLKDYLDENRVVWEDALQDNPIDWAHINSVVYDPSDNSIILSCRLQGVIKIGYDDEIKWIMAPHKDWGTNRRGEDLNVFLLQVVDNGGNEISDVAVLQGGILHSDFEWNWYQHAVDLLPNGDLILFDNGENRNFTGLNRYSRAVQYSIDHNERTIRQVWSYGKERGEYAFSRIVSDVDKLENGNILFCPGFRVDNQNGDGGKIIEIDPSNNEVVFEAEINSNAYITFHRVERMHFSN